MLVNLRIPSPVLRLGDQEYAGLVTEAELKMKDGRFPQWSLHIRLSGGAENPLRAMFWRWSTVDGNRPRRVVVEGADARVAGQVFVARMDPFVLEGNGDVEVSPP